MSEEEIKTIPLGTFYIEGGYYSIKELEDLTQMLKRFNKDQHAALNKAMKRMMGGDPNSIKLQSSCRGDKE